jgi:hypothetical protein
MLNLSLLDLDDLTADPVSPSDGTLWYRGDLNTLYVRSNGSTVGLLTGSVSNNTIPVGNASGGLTDSAITQSGADKLLFPVAGALGNNDPSITFTGNTTTGFNTAGGQNLVRVIANNVKVVDFQSTLANFSLAISSASTISASGNISSNAGNLTAAGPSAQGAAITWGNPANFDRIQALNSNITANRIQYLTDVDGDIAVYSGAYAANTILMTGAVTGELVNSTITQNVGGTQVTIAADLIGDPAAGQFDIGSAGFAAYMSIGDSIDPKFDFYIGANRRLIIDEIGSLALVQADAKIIIDGDGTNTPLLELAGEIAAAPSYYLSLDPTSLTVNRTQQFSDVAGNIGVVTSYNNQRVFLGTSTNGELVNSGLLLNGGLISAPGDAGTQMAPGFISILDLVSLQGNNNTNISIDFSAIDCKISHDDGTMVRVFNNVFQIGDDGNVNNTDFRHYSNTLSRYVQIRPDNLGGIRTQDWTDVDGDIAVYSGTYGNGKIPMLGGVTGELTDSNLVVSGSSPVRIAEDTTKEWIDMYPNDQIRLYSKAIEIARIGTSDTFQIMEGAHLVINPNDSARSTTAGDSSDPKFVHNRVKVANGSGLSAEAVYISAKNIYGKRNQRWSDMEGELQPVGRSSEITLVEDNADKTSGAAWVLGAYYQFVVAAGASADFSGVSNLPSGAVDIGTVIYCTVAATPTYDGATVQPVCPVFNRTMVVTSDNATSTNRSFTLSKRNVWQVSGQVPDADYPAGTRCRVYWNSGTNAGEIQSESSDATIGRDMRTDAGATLTFNAVGETADFEFDGSEWRQITSLITSS